MSGKAARGAVERSGKLPRYNTPCWEAGGWTALADWRGDRAHREIASHGKFDRYPMTIRFIE